MALGEAFAAVVEHQRAVVKRRGGMTQGTEQQQLTEGGFHEVGAAHDLGDAHGGVVDDSGELVAGHIILPPDEEVAEIAAMSVYMGGGPALMYAADAMRAFDQFSEPTPG